QKMTDILTQLLKGGWNSNPLSGKEFIHHLCISTVFIAGRIILQVERIFTMTIFTNRIRQPVKAFFHPVIPAFLITFRGAEFTGKGKGRIRRCSNTTVTTNTEVVFFVALRS